jgi:3-oxoacyl-[acyl-carrier-protein] synthase-3
MFTSRYCEISGISVCVPNSQINNKKFLKINDKNEFIQSTGVKRHFLDLKRKISTSDLCFVAANKVIKNLKWKKKDIGFLLFVSQTRDFVLPATACILQKKLGLNKNILAYDIPLGCSGFVYGLYTAFLMSKNMKSKGLLLTGDMSSKLIDFNDKKISGLFGDAGSAIAIKYEKKLKNFSYFSFGTDGGGYKNLIYDNSELNNSKKKQYLKMDGAKIFEFVLDEVPMQIKKLLKSSKNTIKSIDYFIFHQANKFLIQTLMKKLKITENKVIYSIDEFGNTNSASIPITIFKNLKNKYNIKILISGFGVGYSWASAIIKLNKPKFSGLYKI